MRMSIAGHFPRSDVFLQSATNRVVLKFLSLHMSYIPGNRLMKLTTKGRGVLRQAIPDELQSGGKLQEARGSAWLCQGSVLAEAFGDVV